MNNPELQILFDPPEPASAPPAPTAPKRLPKWSEIPLPMPPGRRAIQGPKLPPRPPGRPVGTPQPIAKPGEPYKPGSKKLRRQFSLDAMLHSPGMERCTQEAAEDFLSEIANGKTTTSFAKKLGVENQIIYKWLAGDPALAEAYRAAKMLGCDSIADECIELADRPCKTKAEVAARRMQIDTRLKLIAKWHAGRYGDKLAVGGAPDLPPLQLTDDERRLRIEAILSLARRRAEEATAEVTCEDGPKLIVSSESEGTPEG